MLATAIQCMSLYDICLRYAADNYFPPYVALPQDVIVNLELRRSDKYYRVSPPWNRGKETAALTSDLINIIRNGVIKSLEGLDDCDQWNEEVYNELGLPDDLIEEKGQYDKIQLRRVRFI